LSEIALITISLSLPSERQGDVGVHDKKVRKPVTSGELWLGVRLGWGGGLARRHQSAGP